jgi:hypothetical protein
VVVSMAGTAWRPPSLSDPRRSAERRGDPEAAPPLAAFDSPDIPTSPYSWE